MIKGRTWYFKTSSGVVGKKLIYQGRVAVLKVVEVSLKAKHRITRISKILEIPRSTYYCYCNWQTSRTACQRQLIKQKLLAIWLKHPMYGYPGLTLGTQSNCQSKRWAKSGLSANAKIGHKLKYAQKHSKPRTHTDYEQHPNLIKKLTDQTSVLLTGITYIPVKRDWTYLASVYNSTTRQVVGL